MVVKVGSRARAQHACSIHVRARLRGKLVGCGPRVRVMHLLFIEILEFNGKKRKKNMAKL